MSGALGYLDLEEGVEATIENFESWLSDYIGIENPEWQVAFGETRFLAVDNPASDFIELSVIGRLSEPIPEEFADDSGKIRTPIFPVGMRAAPDEIPHEETEGYEADLLRTVAELRELENSSGSNQDVLEKIIERHSDRGIIDAFGNPWSERDSILAARAAEQSLSVDKPDAVVSFDIIRKLAYTFQYENFLKYDRHEDGERVEQERIEFDKVTRAEPLSNGQLPEADKVYIYKDERTAASSYEISAGEIASEIRSTVLERGGPCTVADPSGRGLRAEIGSVTRFVLEDDQELYHGFAWVSPEAEVSFLHDFYAALQVPGAPFLTHELAQETSDWDTNRENFSGWSATDDGFAYHSIDQRRDIRRRLFAHKYWIINGEQYRRKSEFEDDVEILIDMIESELECEVAWRRFNGDRISKTPIRPSDVLEQIREEARAPPDQDDLIEAIGIFTGSSQEVENIDRPLFPSDLSEFVADTSIIDAQIITRLISDGDLYRANVIVPDVVLEEVHRQMEQDTSRGERGLEELTALRELAEKKIISLEIATTDDSVNSEDNVSVDQALIQLARERDVPLCSADQKLLEFAEAAGVAAYPLQQELSRWPRLIKQSLQQRGELPLSDLVRIVYQQVDESKVSEDTIHRAMFGGPARTPSQDLATEMAIQEEIEQLERRGEIYRRGNQIGLKKQVTIVPSLDAIENGLVSKEIQEDKFVDKIDLPPHEIRFTVVLPASFEHWASLQADRAYLAELHELEELESTDEIDLEWREVLPSEAGLVLADEEQFSNLFQGVQRKAAMESDHTTAFDSGSGSVMINY